VCRLPLQFEVAAYENEPHSLTYRRSCLCRISRCYVSCVPPRYPKRPSASLDRQFGTQHEIRRRLHGRQATGNPHRLRHTRLPRDQARDFAGAFNKAGFRCILVSRFGYLRTPLPADASPEAQADLYACLLDSLDISEAAIIGVSAGGPSDLQFAIRHPKRCSTLVLLVPATFAPNNGGVRPRSPVVMKLLAKTVLQSDFPFWLMLRAARRTLMENILGTPFAVAEHASPAERERLDAMLMNILPVSRRLAGLLNDGAIVPSLRRFDLDRVEGSHASDERRR
jgi:pimeloyl-ACP methyl ester carboxylesterase